MKKVKKKWYSFVPNSLTALNLLCGTTAIYFSLNGKINIALALMVFAAVCDFFDGFLARILKIDGELGKQLDSLADLVTFGIVPGVMIFWLQTQHIPDFSISSKLSPLQLSFVLTPLLIPLLSALRLAKFNIDERQHNEFIGLPTPANALFIASLAWTLTYRQDSIIDFFNNPFLLTIITVIFSFLLISEIRLFALKFSDFKWKNNRIKYLFLLCSVLLLIFFGITGIAGIIILYIVISLFKNFKRKS